MRIAILWSHLSGYMKACFEELAKTPDIDLLVFYLSSDRPSGTTYNQKLFADLNQSEPLDEATNVWREDVLKRIMVFAPDVVIIAGWSIAGYRYIATHLRRYGIYVVGTCDNPWHGSLRQWLGVLTSAWYVRSFFDALWVPGERAGVFGRKLGFKGNNLIYGLYSANSKSLMPIGYQRINSDRSNWPQRFLFVGRLEPEKGISDLVAAYKRYYSRSSKPWELWVAGEGRLKHLIHSVEGITHLGFLQPDELYRLVLDVGVFVLPSHYDPWPLVVHEMTCVALPILCSRQCGSSVELVQEGYNGFRFEAGDVSALSLYLGLLADMPDLFQLGKNSYHLAARYSPSYWTANLIHHVKAINTLRQK